MGLFSSISDGLSDSFGGTSFLGVDLGGAVGDVLGGLGTALANSAGSIVSSIGQYQTNKKNLENQDYWNQVAVDLANSAHQRNVADLEAAGLNPILAANQGSTTPSLSAATMQNPLASFGTNSKLVADALTGQTQANLKLTEADADSAKAYADNAERLATAEADLAESEARLQSLENDAKADALDGSFSMHGFKGHGGSYADLVKLHKKEIKTGNYKSSLGRAVFQDVMSGASSAADIYRRTRNPSKPGRRP